MRRFLRMGAAVATLCWGGGAVAQTNPVPAGDAASWINQDDYPATALHDAEAGVVRFELEVDTLGKPIRCNILESSGSASLDTRTCEVMMTRASFRPATNRRRKPVPGTWGRRINWQLPTLENAIKVPLSSYAQVEQITFDAACKISACTARKVGELGYQLAGCEKQGGTYVVEQIFGGRYRQGVLTGTAIQRVEGEALPANMPTSDIPPFWVMERSFTVQPDGSVADCIQRESSKGTVPCDGMQAFLPVADGRPRKVTSEMRWAFQPAK